METTAVPPRFGIGPVLELDDRGIAELFEAQVERVPDAIAVIWEDALRRRTELSYRELNLRSNRLAHRLRELGVGRETLVGICLERTPELVVAVMAVLKAGGAYVPLGPASPLDRQRFTIADTAPAAIVTSRSARGSLPETEIPLVSIDEHRELLQSLPGDNPVRQTSPDQIVCIAYTSGSTGTPKGVMVVQRGVLNRVLTWWASWPPRPGDVFGNHSDFLFLPFLNSTIYALSQGISMLLFSAEDVTNPFQLVDSLSRNGVTHGGSPSAFAATLVDQCPDAGRALPRLRIWRFGGGGIDPETWARFRRALPHCELQLAYGATETSTAATHFPDQPERALGERIPCGVALPNVQVYVVAEDGTLAAPGEPGEVWVGGAGPVRGYLNRPEATAERFVPDPFGTAPGARLYRTGDVGRFLPDGMLEVQGRIDHLVKIRGHRVELGEVERALSRHPAVRECVASVSGSDPDRQLAAYLVPRDGTSPTTSELGRFLREWLGEASVPSRFIPIHKIPRTASGKPDRKALPPPDDLRPLLAEEYIPPRSPLEEVLAEIWGRELGYRQVGVRDDFLDLGGHSLAAMRIVARIVEAVGVQTPIQTIFQCRTVEGLSAALHAAQPEGRLERRAELFLAVSRLSEAEAREALSGDR